MGSIIIGLVFVAVAFAAGYATGYCVGLEKTLTCFNGLKNLIVSFE